MIRQALAAVAGVLVLTLSPMARPSVAQVATDAGSISEVFKDLDLTPKQLPQVNKIQANAAAKIRDVLTPEQQSQLDQIARGGAATPGAFKALNLSAQQKVQLDSIQMSVAQALFSVLTPEQQQKLIDLMIARAGKTQP